MQNIETIYVLNVYDRSLGNQMGIYYLCQIGITTELVEVVSAIAIVAALGVNPMILIQ